MSVCFMACVIHFFNPFVLFSSKNLESIMGHTITFVSILTGFTTVIIPKLHEIRETSDSRSLAGRFFKKADMISIQSNISLTVCSGFLLVLVSILIIGSDVMGEDMNYILYCLWFVFLISFCLYQLKIQTIFLKLLFSKSQPHTRVNPSKEEKEKYDAAIPSIDCLLNSESVELSDKIKDG